MIKVTVHQAKSQLSRLIARVEAGEEVVIARGKDPVARLVAVAGESGRRGLAGRMRGKWSVLPDGSFFDTLPEDELRRWEGDGQDASPG